MSSGHKSILGIRAHPSGFHWAIVSGTLERPILEESGTESAPTVYTEPESLVWIREKLAEIIDRFKPTEVAVRFPEPTAMGANKNSAKSRCRVEGVVLEISATKRCPVVTGAFVTFGKYLGGSPKAELKSNEFRGLDWSKQKDVNLREAIVVAVALLRSDLRSANV